MKRVNIYLLAIASERPKERRYFYLLHQPTIADLTELVCDSPGLLKVVGQLHSDPSEGARALVNGSIELISLEAWSKT